MQQGESILSHLQASEFLLGNYPDKLLGAETQILRAELA